MENEMTNYVVKFNAHGFVPGKDVSEENWEKAKAEFMAMQNVFANMTNQILDKVNDTWSKYEWIKENGDCASIYLMQQAMEIEEKATYGDWVEKWYKDVCKAVDAMSMLSGFSIRSHLFRDGDLPVFGTEFKTKPEWWIDFVLIPEE